MCGLGSLTVSRAQDNRLNHFTLCGDFICDAETHNWMERMKTVPALRTLGFLCDGQLNCQNTDLDEKSCAADEMVSYKSVASGQIYKQTDLCNEKLSIATKKHYHMESYEDEANCNGYRYGIYCQEGNIYYQPAFMVCSIESFGGIRGKCRLANDDCLMKNTTEFSCLHITLDSIAVGRVVPILNYTRCAPFQLDAHKDPYIEFFSYCENFMDQTNCTDSSRVGLWCKINGYMSSVSRMKMCVGTSVCDDGLDINCVAASPVCTVHKHKLCDKVIDCPFDEMDEKHPICRRVTKTVCIRMIVSNDSLPIPLSWLQDGVEDCLDGRDEREGWPSCGNGKTFRFVNDDSTCENVLFVGWESLATYCMIDCVMEKKRVVTKRAFVKHLASLSRQRH